MKKINKADEKIEEISKGLKDGISFCFWTVISLLNTFLRFVVIGGAIASFILLYKLFPSYFNKILLVFVRVLAIIGLIFGAIWIGIKLGLFMFDVTKRNRIKREKSREKFLDDLADKMNKRLKKK